MKKDIEIICENNKNLESCGFITFQKNNFIVSECKNISKNPKSNFEISFKDHVSFLKKNIIAVFHSHVISGDIFSENDKKHSEEIMVPYLVYSLKNKKHNAYIPKNIRKSKAMDLFLKKIKNY
jgi:proteasome lid subunit RPN8/RPN11